jgi:hypothetical protein
MMHAKALRLTFGGKKYDTSSKLNSVPPIGAPNATATPAAQAALNISLRLASTASDKRKAGRTREPTFIVLVFTRETTDYIADATSNVHKRSFFA